MCSSLPCSFSSCPPRAPPLPSQLYNLLPARACVSERSDTKSASYSIIHADGERRVVGAGGWGGGCTQTGQLQDGASSLSHLVPPSASSFPYLSVLPPPTPVSSGEACINLLRPVSPLSSLSLHFGWREKRNRNGRNSRGKSHPKVARHSRVDHANVILSFAVKGKSRRNSISASWYNNSLPHVCPEQSQSGQALFPHGHFCIFYHLRLMLSRQTV